MTSLIATDAEVRAYLDGRKTMSMVLCRPQPDYVDVSPQGTVASINYKVGVPLALCPYSIGQPIHVKETWGIDPNDMGMSRDFVTYRVKSGIVDFYWGWLSPVVMPQEYSRITLTPTAIRLIRVQEIDNFDAKYLGVMEEMEAMWDARYAKPRPVRRRGKIVDHISYPWSANPWTWLIEHAVRTNG